MALARCGAIAMFLVSIYGISVLLLAQPNHQVDLLLSQALDLDSVVPEDSSVQVQAFQVCVAQSPR